MQEEVASHVPLPTKGYTVAVGLLHWLAGQRLVVAPEYWFRAQAAAVAACLDAKDETIKRLLGRLAVEEAERKCPSCGVTLKAVTLDRLRDNGLDGFRCLDKACPPFETWPEAQK